MNFWIYSVPMVIFEIFEIFFLRIVHTLYGSLFLLFTHLCDLHLKSNKVNTRHSCLNTIHCIDFFLYNEINKLDVKWILNGVAIKVCVLYSKSFMFLELLNKVGQDNFIDMQRQVKLPSYKIALNFRTCCDFLPSLTIFFQPPYLFQAQFHLVF